MSVTATAVDTPQVTTEDVRWFMRDFNGRVPNTGVTNILLDGVEFSNEDINRAIRFTVSRWNLIAPISSDSAGTVPDWLLMVGVCEMLLISEAMRQNRNALTYTDGNVAPIGIDDKMQAYMALAQLMKSEFEEKTKVYKVTRNLDLAWGSLGSGYRISTRYG
jgi:hypothetical protein